MNHKAFTLIELLVVVAIIGILAAVGVVAYNGYTGAAKVSTVKSIYTSTIKYIQSEIQLCNLGEESIMQGCVKCNKLFSGSITPASQIIVCMENTSTDKNPYSSKNWPYSRAVNSGKDNSDDALGKVLMNSEGNPVGTGIYTSVCFKTPCSNTNNTLSTTVEIKE